MKNNNSIFFGVKKYILYFLMILTFFVGIKVFAQDDITSSDFTINVGEIDPIHWNTSSSGPSWWEALKNVLETISSVILMLIPLLAWVAWVIAGYFYIFSYSDSDNITKAKTIIKYNIMAIVVAFLSGWIIRVIASFL